LSPLHLSTLFPYTTLFRSSSLTISQPVLAAAFLVVLGVAAEGARWREFSQFMSDHGFGNKYRYVLATIVDSNGVSQHVRDDHRATRPSADNVFGALFVLSKNLQVQVLIYVGALLPAAWLLRSASIDSSFFSDDDARCTGRWLSSDGVYGLPSYRWGWTYDVHQMCDLHHHRVGDPPGSLRRHGSADERLCGAYVLLYPRRCRFVRHCRLHQHLHGNQHPRYGFHRSVDDSEHIRLLEQPAD